MNFRKAWAMMNFTIYTTAVLAPRQIGLSLQVYLNCSWEVFDAAYMGNACSRRLLIDSRSSLMQALNARSTYVHNQLYIMIIFWRKGQRER